MYIIKKNGKNVLRTRTYQQNPCLFKKYIFSRTKKKWTMFKIVCRLFFFNTVIYKLDKMGIDYS